MRWLGWMMLLLGGMSSVLAAQQCATYTDDLQQVGSITFCVNDDGTTIYFLSNAQDVGIFLPLLNPGDSIGICPFGIAPGVCPPAGVKVNYTVSCGSGALPVYNAPPIAVPNPTGGLLLSQPYTAVFGVCSEQKTRWEMSSVALQGIADIARAHANCITIMGTAQHSRVQNFIFSNYNAQLSLCLLGPQMQCKLPVATVQVQSIPPLNPIQNVTIIGCYFNNTFKALEGSRNQSMELETNLGAAFAQQGFVNETSGPGDLVSLNIIDCAFGAVGEIMSIDSMVFPIGYSLNIVNTPNFTCIVVLSYDNNNPVNSPFVYQVAPCATTYGSQTLSPGRQDSIYKTPSQISCNSINTGIQNAVNIADSVPIALGIVFGGGILVLIISQGARRAWAFEQHRRTATLEKHQQTIEQLHHQGQQAMAQTQQDNAMKLHINVQDMLHQAQAHANATAAATAAEKSKKKVE